MINLGINGFGRIGRTSFRVWWQSHKDRIDLKLINTSGSMDIAGWVHLLKYDTNYGVFPDNLSFEEAKPAKEASDEDPVIGHLKVGDRSIVVTAQRDPKKIPWAVHDVHTVIESTGIFTTAEKASWHKEAGAKRVIISAPGKGDGIAVSVLGVSDYQESDTIIDNASCTTNSVAPVVQIINQSLGIEKASLTTIHSYTDDQNTQDNSHKKDLRRARSAAENIIPTSTGAAKATTKLLPNLQNKFDGIAVRVPTPVGSLSDMTFVTSRNTTIEEVNALLSEAASQAHWQGILAVTDEPVVSSDIVGRSESSIVDLGLTNVIGGNLVKVVAWYDNEWGYCNRLVEQVR